MQSVPAMNSESMKYFCENYDVIKAHDFSQYSKKTYSYQADMPKRCLFCGKPIDETSFKNDAHAIPEFLGNHFLLTPHECDACNSKFAYAYEDQLSKFTLPERSLCQVDGKKRRVPTYKSDKGDLRFESPKEGAIQIKVQESLFGLDEKNKVVGMPMSSQKYVPLRAYKAFVRMILNIVEFEYAKIHLQHLIDWINDVDLSVMESFYKPLELIRGFIPGPMPLQSMRVELYQRKDIRPIENVPFLQFVYGYCNTIYQIFVFTDVDIKRIEHEEYIFRRFPLSISPKGEVKYSKIDMSSMDETVTKFNAELGFTEIAEITK